jgi:hypothetical protein
VAALRCTYVEGKRQQRPNNSPALGAGEALGFTQILADLRNAAAGGRVGLGREDGTDGSRGPGLCFTVPSVEGRGLIDHIEPICLAADTCRMAKMIKPLPAGFVVPAQPAKTPKPPVGTDWVHEIKHDGYRIIVRRDGPTVRLYSRNAYDWTARLASIASAAERIKSKSFTIDGEAVVLGPDGLSRFEELQRRTAVPTPRSSMPST